MGSKRHPDKAPAAGEVAHRDVDIAELKAVLERARVAPLSAEDHALLTGAVDTFTAMTRELQLKGVTLERLRRLFLGSTSEKTKKVLGDEEKEKKSGHTPWCTPCQKMGPIVDALKGIKVVKIDLDQSEALGAREKLEGVPVFVLYVDGKERARLAGEQTAAALEGLSKR